MMEFLEGGCLVRSHYVRCVVKDSFERIFEALSNRSIGLGLVVENQIPYFGRGDS
jgi:hypothetical protein